MNTNPTTNGISNSIEKLLGNSDNFTFYKVSSVVSEITHKNVRPQQVRNYMLNGLIKWIETPEGRRIPREEAIRWITKYATKHTA